MITFLGTNNASAVIFDFDGVIVDTEPLHFKAFNQVLQSYQLQISWEDYCVVYMGLDDRDAFTEIFKQNSQTLQPNLLKSLIQEKTIAFQSIIANGVTPYPGVCDLITSLFNNNVPIAICSGALYSDIEPILQQLGIISYIPVIVTADMVAKSKPDPESYLLAFRKLAEHWRDYTLSPATTVAIEDTPAGISSALQAGLRVIAVTNSYSQHHLTQATDIIDSLEVLHSFQP